jgi:GxxExxY protein
VSQRHAITVCYTGIGVGERTADLLVDGAVVVELNAVQAPDRVRAAQCMSHLKATRLRRCPLLNFGKARLKIRRIAN